MVFDYDGNLWFATGGFRIYPQRQQQGVIGYIARSAIDAILNGEQTDLSKAVFVYELTPGEGAENGIAASKDGAVILTNQNCYLLRAEEGVDVVWCTPYESAGAKVSGEGDKTTGGGLAWGGGCSPTLTPNLVLFTDNQDIVNLLALDMKTGEVVASAPVLDDLPEGYQVAVENSAIVYDDGNGTVSTIVCNWFGAGNAGLADPNNDSSIQSYANIYDQNWLMKGNVMIAPRHRAHGHRKDRKRLRDEEHLEPERPERHFHPEAFHRNGLYLRLCAGCDHRDVAVHHSGF